MILTWSLFVFVLLPLAWLEVMILQWLSACEWLRWSSNSRFVARWPCLVNRTKCFSAFVPYLVASAMSTCFLKVSFVVIFKRSLCLLPSACFISFILLVYLDSLLASWHPSCLCARSRCSEICSRGRFDEKCVTIAHKEIEFTCPHCHDLSSHDRCVLCFRSSELNLTHVKPSPKRHRIPSNWTLASSLWKILHLEGAMVFISRLEYKH